MPPQTQAFNPVTPAKKFPTWLKILLIVFGSIVVLAAGIFILVMTLTKDATKVSDRLVADVQSDNTKDAYSLTSPAFKQASSEEELAQVIDRTSSVLKGKAHITDRAIRKTTDGRTVTIIVYKIDTANGAKYIRVALEKVDGKWLVYYYRSSDSLLDASSLD